MADPEHMALLEQGSDAWNQWRHDNPDAHPNLAGIDLERDVWKGHGLYELPFLDGYDFSGGHLGHITARNSYFQSCSFDHARINYADLCFSTFQGCSFVGTEMRVTRIGSAHFNECEFRNSDLAYCSAEETDFSGSSFIECGLDHMSLVKCDFSGTTLQRVSAYGTSAWDLDLRQAVQRDIFLDEDRSLLVDDIEIAQFVHLLVRNHKLREVIDTITSKVVLLLGRFTPERKDVLTSLRTYFRTVGYVPVIFDFQPPRSRDLTETVSTLAHLARFVVVDLTDPRSVPHELASLIPSLPSVPVQPLIAEGQDPYGLFEHWERFPWVLPVLSYPVDSAESLAPAVLAACESALDR